MCNEELNRRKFLKLLGAGVLGATIDTYANPFERAVVYADPLQAATNAGYYISVFLAGGPSECWRPVYESGYYDLYPTLSLQPGDSLPFNNSGIPQGMANQMSDIHQFIMSGQGAVINGVGFPRATRSHAADTEFHDSGISSMSLRDGTGLGARLVAAEGPFGGICFQSGSLWARGPVGNVSTGNRIVDNFTPTNFTYNRYEDHFKAMRDNMLAAERQFAAGNKNAQYVLNSLHKGISNAENLVESINKPLPGDYTFPEEGFAYQCKETAALLLSELGMKAAKLTLSGFDTHANQINRTNDLWSRLNNGLKPLIDTLIAAGVWERTFIGVFGEFCRTQENGNGGTDHGISGPFLALSGKQFTNSVIGGPLYSTRTRTYVEEFTWDIRDVIAEGVASVGFQTDNLFPDKSVFKPVGMFA